MEETPDITLAQALLKERDLSVGTGTVWRFFDRHGISVKKKPRTPPSRSVTSPRAGWLGCQPDLDPRRLVFDDGASTKGPSGEPRSVANAAVPRSHMHWKTPVYRDGRTAPMLLEGR